MSNKIYAIILFALVSIIFVSCGNSIDEDKFIKVYKEILMTRMSENDSLKANQKVDEILKKNGYNLNQFKNDFFELAKDNSNFLKIIDSLRSNIKADEKNILDKEKIQKKKPKEFSE